MPPPDEECFPTFLKRKIAEGVSRVIEVEMFAPDTSKFGEEAPVYVPLPPQMHKLLCSLPVRIRVTSSGVVRRSCNLQAGMDASSGAIIQTGKHTKAG